MDRRHQPPADRFVDPRLGADVRGSVPGTAVASAEYTGAARRWPVVRGILLAMIAATWAACSGKAPTADGDRGRSSSRAEGELDPSPRSTAVGEDREPVAPRLLRRPDLVPTLRSGGFDGIFVAHEAGADTAWCVGDERCTRRVSPASTFKVPHALIGLDAGVLEGPHHYVPWDGKKRAMEAWNQGHTLASAIRESVVWYFQHLARTLGRERLQRGLGRLQYGNQRIGDKVDRFWLDGSLAISPVEQVAFWHRLHERALDVTPAALDHVLAMTELARQSNVVLRGKTGWYRPEVDGAEHGWFAGCLDGPKRVCFATVLFPVKPYDVRDALGARVRVSKALLGELGYMVP